MGRTPNVIFRELYKQQKKKNDAIKAQGAETPFMKLNEEDHCCYVIYQEAVKAFMMEGYSEQKAIKHITTWLDNDFLTTRYTDTGYRLIGIYKDVM